MPGGTKKSPARRPLPRPHQLPMSSIRGEMVPPNAWSMERPLAPRLLCETVAEVEKEVPPPLRKSKPRRKRKIKSSKIRPVERKTTASPPLPTDAQRCDVTEGTATGPPLLDLRIDEEESCESKNEIVEENLDSEVGRKDIDVNPPCETSFAPAANLPDTSEHYEEVNHYGISALVESLSLETALSHPHGSLLSNGIYLPNISENGEFVSPFDSVDVDDPFEIASLATVVPQPDTSNGFADETGNENNMNTEAGEEGECETSEADRRSSLLESVSKNMTSYFFKS